MWASPRQPRFHWREILRLGFLLNLLDFDSPSSGFSIFTIFLSLSHLEFTSKKTDEKTFKNRLSLRPGMNSRIYVGNIIQLWISRLSGIERYTSLTGIRQWQPFPRGEINREPSLIPSRSTRTSPASDLTPLSNLQISAVLNVPKETRLG